MKSVLSLSRYGSLGGIVSGVVVLGKTLGPTPRRMVQYCKFAQTSFIPNGNNNIIMPVPYSLCIGKLGNIHLYLKNPQDMFMRPVFKTIVVKPPWQYPWHHRPRYLQLYIPCIWDSRYPQVFQSPTALHGDLHPRFLIRNNLTFLEGYPKIRIF